MGFTAGAAILCISAQIKRLLGMSGVTGWGIVTIWTKLIENYYTVTTADAVMGLSSIVVLILLQVNYIFFISFTRK